jgi:hypothetical protein
MGKIGRVAYQTGAVTVPSSELGVVERAALLALMAEAREVPNAFLTNSIKIELKKDSRLRLAKLGLINVRQEKNRFHLELSERGWKWCVDELGQSPPPKAGSMGGALYAILNALGRSLPRHELGLADLLGDAGHELVAPPPAATIEERIRGVYAELARRPGSWVKLADLRAKLPVLDRDVVDEALVRMNHEDDVRVAPEANQKTLTREDREAAVIIGNRDRHLLAIGV